MTEVMRASMAQLSFTTLILGAAALVTLLLGAIGLYGVMAYLVTLRTRELGVRIALGAQPSSVAAMMTGQGLALTAAGIVAGWESSRSSHLPEVVPVRVAPSDPLTLGRRRSYSSRSPRSRAGFLRDGRRGRSSEHPARE